MTGESEVSCSEIFPLGSRGSSPVSLDVSNLPPFAPPPLCFPSVFPFFFIGFRWHQNGIHKEWQPTRHSRELTLMYVASATEELLFLKAIHGMDGIPGVVNCFHVLTPFLPASSFDSAPPHLSISRRSARSLSFPPLHPISLW